MTGLIILLFSLILSSLFLVFSAEGSRSYFPFSEMLLNPQSYFYFLFDHINEILVPIGVFLGRKYVRALIIFCVIQFIDTLDYALCYSSPWFDSPPSFN